MDSTLYELNKLTMATIYKIEIKTVSAFTNYSPQQMQEILQQMIEDHRNKNGQGFESTEVNVERI